MKEMAEKILFWIFVSGFAFCLVCDVFNLINTLELIKFYLWTIAIGIVLLGVKLDMMMTIFLEYSWRNK